ncbi:DUF4214 domain-containing protein [Salipiger pentaromativorans]|uniref:DUF4214 domain-containing protein n=1 Tax=Salipiger pentaromativorans TaxID=2943193 RepID=UPI00237CFD94|nr:DUF4214 domain-containing protein [Salipiger pentaromativorans]
MSISLTGFAAVADEFQVNSETAGNQRTPSITVLSGGGVVEIWQSAASDPAQSGLFGQVFDASGAPVGGEFAIAGASEDAQSPFVTPLADGGFALSWKDSSGDSPFGAILVQRFDADGQAVGSAVEVSAPSDSVRSNPSVIERADGGLTVVWQVLDQDGSNWGIFARQVDSLGAVSGAEYQINATVLNAQAEPAVTALADGRLLAVWSSASADGTTVDIVARFLDADGLPIGAEIQVNESATGLRAAPDVAVLADGGLVAVWQDDTTGGIFGRMFDTSGAPLGSEFRIDSDVGDQAALPSVVAVPTGGFLVVYQDGDSATGDVEVFGKLYDSAGQRIGRAQQINSFDSSIQSAPVVDILDDGNAMVSWQSNTQDGDGYGIFRQIIVLNQPTTGTVEISGTAEEEQVLTAVAMLEDGNGIGTLSYRWYRDDQLVQDSDQATYALTQDDVGAAISVVVAHTDLDGFVDLIESPATDSVVNVENPGAGLPELTGELRVGQVLAVDVSSVSDIDGIAEIQYAWAVGNIPLPGATGPMLRLLQAHYGLEVTATVTVIDNAGEETVFQVQSGGTVDDRPRELLLSEVIETELLYPVEPDAVIRTEEDTAYALFYGENEVTFAAFDLTTGTELASGAFDPAWEFPIHMSIRRTGSVGDYGYALYDDPAWEFDRNDPDAVADTYLRVFTLEDGALVFEDINLGIVPKDFAGLSFDRKFVNAISDDALLVTHGSYAQLVKIGADGLEIADTFTFLQDPIYVTPKVIPLTDDLYILAVANSYWFTPVFSAQIRSLSSDLVIEIDLGDQAASRYGEHYHVSEIYLQEGDDGLYYLDVAKTTAYYDVAPFVQRVVLDLSGPEPEVVSSFELPVFERNDPSPDYLSDTGLLADGILSSPVFVETENGTYRLVIENYELNAAPEGQPEILGALAQGNTLLADTSQIVDADGMTDLQFNWWRDGTKIEGATSATYELTQQDVGHAITVLVSYRDGAGRLEHVLSDASVPVANVNDAPTGAILIYDIPAGGLGSHIVGLQDPDGLGALSYQWLRDGAPIAGATGATYQPVAADSGHEITVTVSYTDGFGTPESLESTEIATVSGSPSGDILIGTTGAEALFGLAGNDVLVGVSGADYLLGGPGNDWLSGEGTVAASYGLTVANQVFRLYQSAFDSTPDAGGYTAWSGRIATDELTLLQVAERFVNAPQFQKTYGALDDVAFVELLYQNVLDRAPDPTGLARWVGELESGSSRAEVLLGFSQSPQFIAATNDRAIAFALDDLASDWSDEVFRLYQATLDRAPDLGGFQNWSTRLGSGMSFDTVIESFVNSREFQSIYGDLDDADFVTMLYDNVMDRAPDPAGFDRWTGELASGASRADVVRGFIQSQEFINATTAGLESWIRAQGTDDVLEAGMGSNTLYGGLLSDTFVFDAERPGAHRVMDLESWDSLVFSRFGYAHGADAIAHMTEVGADVVFEDQGVVVTFVDVDLTDITATMIL